MKPAIRWDDLPQSERLRLLITSVDQLTPEERAALPPPPTDEALAKALRGSPTPDWPRVQRCLRLIDGVCEDCAGRVASANALVRVV